MINLTEIVNDPDFAQSFTVQRSRGGEFGPSGWIDASVTVNFYGVIQPASGLDLKQIPEGDRVEAAIKILAEQQLYITHNGAEPGLSDIVMWQSEGWRVMSCIPWNDFGFFKCIAVRIVGD